jgi:hypothetical protein
MSNGKRSKVNKAETGAELRGLADGQVRPSKADRRRRNMLIPTSKGAAPVAIYGSTQASQLGRYMSAVGKYLRTGKTDALEEFAGQSIAGHPLITDPEQLSSLAQAGLSNSTKSTRCRGRRHDE